MNNIKLNSNETEWWFEVAEYEGTQTAEEFASEFGIIAVNDNDDDTYIFVGSHDNVFAAFEAYSNSLTA